MKHLLILLLSLTFTVSHSLEKKKDIIITKNNVKIECYIKGFNSKKEIEILKYKLNKKSNIEIINLNKVKIVSFANGENYTVSNVEIDMSNDRLSSLVLNKDFILEKKRLMLKNLVIGDANLYMTNLDGVEKFFYKTNKTDKIVQLLHKKYLAERNIDLVGNYEIVDNNYFLRQIHKDISCDKVGDMKRLLPIKKARLIERFELFNISCN